MADKYDMLDKEKDELAQSMGFGSWDEYINLDTERVPEPRSLANSVDYSKVPDLNLSEEERDRLSNISNGGLASAEAQGKHSWSLEEKLDIHNFREESIGKGRYRTKPSLDYVRDKMNEKYGEDWTTKQVKEAYLRNKHLLSDEERSELGWKGFHLWTLEEIAELGELKYEQGLTWKDITSKMNEKYGEDWTTKQVRLAYHNNKYKLTDEEE